MVSAVTPSGGRLAGKYDLSMICVAATSPFGYDALASNWQIACDIAAEHDRTMDPSRLRLVGPFKDGISGINRCQFFGSFNTSKLSLQLNLKHPVGADIARRLLQWCDVALDSFTAGTMASLGFDYEPAG